MTKFSLSENSKGSKSLAIFFDNGDSDTIPETHVSFKSIMGSLLDGTATDETVRPLLEVMKTVATRMTSLSERVSVDGKNVYFDGDPVDGEVMKVIKSSFEEGRDLDFKPLVNFLEKSKTNPSLKSLDDLYRWIKNGDLVIDPDGDIVAYKTVLIKNGEPVSVHDGTAFVNGEEFTGHIPNSPGTVISMARSQVNADEFTHCSYGLHAGTHAYAEEFASWQHRHGLETKLILVKINPRDVVAVPNDHSAAKMRVSRYVVLSMIDAKLTSKIYDSGFSDEPEEEMIEEVSQSTNGRDAYGRFTKESAVKAVRDSKGRFIRGN